MTAAILAAVLTILNFALLLALGRPRPLIAVLVLVVIASSGLVVYRPAYLALYIAVAVAGAGLLVFMLVRRSVLARGGSELWRRWLKLRITPAFTAAARENKRKLVERLVQDTEKLDRQRDRAAELHKHQAIEREARAIVAATDALWVEFGGRAFVDRRRMLDGAYFCIRDELPYPHEDTLALYAKFADDGAAVYCVRKGQVLDDKQVFQAYAPAEELNRLKDATAKLEQQLRTLVSAIETRAGTAPLR